MLETIPDYVRAHIVATITAIAFMKEKYKGRRQVEKEKVRSAGAVWGRGDFRL